jgi:hypothetical protein
MRIPLRTNSVGWAVVAATLVCITACGGDAPPPPKATVATPAPRAPAPGDPSCPRDGLWKPCALVDRIVKAGLSFKEAGDTIRVAYLSVPGVRYKVGTRATLVAFFYADSTTLQRDLAPLDTMRIVPRGDTMPRWGGTPSAVRSANLLAVLIDGSATQIERIGLAITAGAPQASSEAAAVKLPSVPNRQ